MPEASHLLSAQDLLALVESFQRLSQKIDSQALLDEILGRACELTDSPLGAVFLLDSREGRSGLYFAAANGDTAETVLREVGRDGPKRVGRDSIAGRVFDSGESILQNNVSSDPRHDASIDQKTKISTESMICVPLVSGGERLGAIQLLNRTSGPYTERERLLLEYFGTQAAQAIRTSNLFEALLAHMGLYTTHDASILVAHLNERARTEKVTVLFADMRGFTQLCNLLDAEDLQLRLNEFLTMLANDITRAGGVVNKFLGDGALAFFIADEAPDSLPAPIRALRCASDIVLHFHELAEGWKQDSNVSLDFLDVGIGITTSRVAIGAIGNSVVKDYTVIGSGVNLASAFTVDARGTDAEGARKRILVDQATLSAAQQHVAQVHGPYKFVLRKHDQVFGKEFNQYNVLRLKCAHPVRVFISHNSADRELVEASVVQPLKDRGLDTWYCKERLIPGQNYVEEIAQALKSCDWIVVLISKHALLAPEWITAEVKAALHDPKFAGRIIPVVLDDTLPSHVCPELAPLEYLNARVTPDLADKLLDLLTAAPPRTADSVSTHA